MALRCASWRFIGHAFQEVCGSPASLRCCSSICASCIDEVEQQQVVAVSSAEPNWNELPEEIIDLIFCYLNDRDHAVVEQVCKSWRLSSRTHRTILDVSCYSMKTRRSNFDNAIFEAKISVLPRLQVIQLEDCSKINDDSMRLIANNAPSLRKLRLSRTSVTSEGLQIVVKSCPQLRELHFGKSLVDEKLDNMLLYISQWSNKLEVLQLPECYSVTSLGLQYLSQNGSGIEELDLSCCDMVTDRGLAYLAAGCPNLKKLDLLQCTRLTDQGLINLASGCHKLEEVILYECEEVGDAGLMALCENCPNLQALMLSNTSVTDKTLRLVGNDSFV